MRIFYAIQWAALWSIASSSDVSQKKPNFLFILTDDQDLHMQSIDYMPLLKKHLSSQGTTYEKHYCTVSICCPHPLVFSIHPSFNRPRIDPFAQTSQRPRLRSMVRRSSPNRSLQFTASQKGKCNHESMGCCGTSPPRHLFLVVVLIFWLGATKV